MLLAYFVSIITGIFSGITESINKNITEEKYSVFSYFTLQIGLNLLLITIPFLLFGSFPKLGIVYIYMFLANVAILIGNSSAIKAYKTEDISVINILSHSSLVISFITGVVILSEKASLLNLLGIASIILGIIIIFYERKKVLPSSGLLLAFLGGIMFGVVAYLDKLALGYTDPLSFLFLFNVFISGILLFIPQTYRHIKPILLKYKGKIMLSRITAVTSFYLLITSFVQGSISINNTNFETMYLLSTMTIGIILFKERQNIPKKLAGSALCTLGIILLNFF